MIKKMITLLILVLFIIVFSKTSFQAAKQIDLSSRNYYLEHTYTETGSNNFVTGIYLDYRLFDTLFEASILMIAVSGIIFMSKRDDEIL